MTMPHERTRSLVGTREFLVDLSKRKDLPQDVRDGAMWCLRHYPEDFHIEAMAIARPDYFSKVGDE
jgi:hypothetical protein